jgi:hypothetical protein
VNSDSNSSLAHIDRVIHSSDVASQSAPPDHVGGVDVLHSGLQAVSFEVLHYLVLHKFLGKEKVNFIKNEENHDGEVRMRSLSGERCCDTVWG